MPRLSIALLGPPRIEQDEAPIAVDTRKAIALLAYLALGEPNGASRASLAALFWPDVDQSRAHGALRRTLSVLNKALAGNWLNIDRDAIALVRSDDVWIDVHAFHAHLEASRAHGHAPQSACAQCLQQLAQVVALYRDGFMAGFSLRDSPGFDEWQFFQGEALQRALAGALERLVSGHVLANEYETALGYARRWLALDPLHEPAHVRLMQLYAWAGHRSASLRQYQDCVQVLDKELGVAPLDETTQVYHAIKENRLAAPAEAAPAAPSPAAAPAPVERQLPLVGRAAEWSALQSAYRAIGPDGRLIVLEGEAGIGKTRLAEAALHAVRAQSAVGLVARCYEGELNLAYGPFVEALRSALEHVPGAPARVGALAPHWLSEAARLLPELRGLRPDLPATTPPGSPGAQGRFFEAVRQVLLAVLTPPPGAATAPAPGVLLIDDAHWLDEASLDLLTYLVRRLRGQPVGLLVTWRGEQVPPGHRLRHLLAEALRAGLAANVTLGRLSLAAVAELAGALVPSAAGSALVQRLYAETEGLPFFIIEYLVSVAQAVEKGADVPWEMPGGVRHLLQARLAAVDETARQLLQTAAAIGRSFDLDTLQDASGRSEEETAQGLEALLAAGLVDEVSGAGPAGDQLPDRPAPTYDFEHEKLRAWVYEQTSLARRRLLHGRVAAALSARASRWPAARAGAVASRVAQHYLAAGREAEAAEYFQLAGEHARALYANGDALAHFRAALALGHPAPLVLHESIGDLQTLQGDYTAALASYAEAALGLGAEPPADQAGRLNHKVGNVYHRRGDWPQAEAAFETALADYERGEAGPAVRARLYADWSLTAHRHGFTDRALTLARQGLSLAEEAEDERALAQAHNILGILAGSRADQAAAHRHLEHSLRLAEAQGDPGARAAALNNLALALAAGDEHERALALAEQALALIVAQGDRHREAALHSHLADLLHATGRPEAAMQHLKQSVTIYAEIGAQAGALQPEIWKLAEW